MTLIDTLKSTFAKGQRQIPPLVDHQLYSPSVRSTLQKLIDDHHFQLANRELLDQMSQHGYAFVGTEVCQNETDRGNFIFNCAQKYGAIIALSPVHITYGQPALNSPEPARNFVLTKAISASRCPTFELYHTFVRYALPTTLPRN